MDATTGGKMIEGSKENTEKHSTITFSADCRTWVMKLVKEEGRVRILFNREDYPNAAPDDFAKAVVEILELKFPNLDIETKSDLCVQGDKIE